MHNWKILVTGGTSGIGMACCQQLLEKGCSVWTWARHPADWSHPNLHFIACDLADPKSRAAALKETLSATGGCLDGLVLNAAWYALSPGLSESITTVRTAFEVIFLPITTFCATWSPHFWLAKANQSFWFRAPYPIDP